LRFEILLLEPLKGDLDGVGDLFLSLLGLFAINRLGGLLSLEAVDRPKSYWYFLLI
jgi:hypothetical protein